MSRQQPIDTCAPTILDYLRLFRLPNVFTAIADILMGFSFAGPSQGAWRALPLLVLASACLYTAGMIWNDVFDLEVDRRERPQRPLPSGRIGLATARRWGTLLLAAGPILAAAAAWLAAEPYSRWLAPGIACGLVVLVLAYDGWLKTTVAGPWAMGGCRVANVLLGMSLLPTTGAAQGAGWIWTPDMWSAALGIGVYISGVTWFARQEAQHSQRSGLLWGIGWISVGLVMLAAIPLAAGPVRAGWFRLPPGWWAAFVALLSFTVLRRCFAAVQQPSPAKVQQAVKFAILSLITLDAAVTLLVSPWPWMAALVAVLAIPALWLGKWVYST